ncbi:DNA primase RepB-like protein [Pseudaminobacter salicylatoxidans]|uniref:DNA primase RepB-like protein n=1 Tax=Pseudaminobacter salicylatoxidans TaxID=93369 RepID=A0A316C0X7_PSESE|nr:VapE domain-containing protein [Pseudaminobacter salicylatoxidans]PWJ81660.1 DNA primase RepB-like protein [Pseudaminobacter salicylatoxidans]
MADRLEPNSDHAINYLLWINPDAPIYLEHMESAGRESPTVETYQQHDADSAKRFVTANNGHEFQRNLYYMPNARLLNGKRAKANVSGSDFLWADLDGKHFPGNEAERLDTILALLTEDKRRPKGVPPPTAIIFSGGGYQALWKLSEPIPSEQAENMNRALLEAFGGASGPIAVSQLLRLPGTVNWLNDGKRADGRKPASALLLDPPNFSKPPTTYRAEDFKLRLPKDKALTVPGSRQTDIMPTEIAPLPLPEDLGEIIPSNLKWVQVMVTGEDPPDKTYPSRSERMMACLCWMLGNGVQPGHALSILLDPDYAIGAHVREKPNSLRYGQRQVARALMTIQAGREDWPEVDEKLQPIRDHPANIRYALARLGVEVRRNIFSFTNDVEGIGLEGRDLNDVADILSSRFQLSLKFKASTAAIKTELVAIGHEQTYHPIIEYFDGLVWDGKPRIDGLLRDYAGADDTELNREFGAKFMIAGVRRVKRPGVKFDTMLVFEGSQGTGKSSFAETLAVRDEWFCGSLSLKSDDKTKAELLAGAWIVEVQEMDGIRKASSHELKKFLSTRRDKYRRAYGRDARTYPRQYVIIGSTNDEKYLFDQTGNRRFWPVRGGRIQLDKLRADLYQLRAEAVVREAAGESISLSEHLWSAACELQNLRLVEDAFAGVLEDWFAGKTGRVSMDSVKFLLGFEGGRLSSVEVQRIKAEMARLGWEDRTNRLYDLAQREQTQRRGFARGRLDERKVEWLAKRGEGGMTTLVPLTNPAAQKEPPF